MEEETEKSVEDNGEDDEGVEVDVKGFGGGGGNGDERKGCSYGADLPLPTAAALADAAGVFIGTEVAPSAIDATTSH